MDYEQINGVPLFNANIDTEHLVSWLEPHVGANGQGRHCLASLAGR